MKKIIIVSVTPRSNKNEVFPLEESNYRVKLSALPREGQANKKLIEVMSKFFDIPKSCVQIVKGERSKKKILEIET